MLSYQLTASKVHESQMFEEVCKELPSNVRMKRSPADSAYDDESRLAAARQRGAVPFHGTKKNARCLPRPITLYQKMAYFARHWSNCFASLGAKRNHAGTVFSIIDALLGRRLKCRKRAERRNEVRIKFCLFNLIKLAMRKEFWS